MDLMKQIVERAKANKQRIVLPEGTEERTLRAADRLIADEVVDIILIGNPDEILALAGKLGLQNIGKATIIDPANNPRKEVYANLLFELRKAKGMTMEKALVLAADPLYLGTLIIKNGDADGEVAGARNTTGDVLRPALQIIKTVPGVSVVCIPDVYPQTRIWRKRSAHLCRLRRNAQSQCTRVGSDSRIDSPYRSRHSRY